MLLRLEHTFHVWSQKIPNFHMLGSIRLDKPDIQVATIVGFKTTTLGCTQMVHDLGIASYNKTISCTTYCWHTGKLALNIADRRGNGSHVDIC